MTILKETGIVIDGQFYTEAAVKAALSGVKGERVTVSGNRKDGIVLSVPTEKGILVAYDDGGGDEYPGVNVDILTKKDGDKTVLGLATIENIQPHTDNGDKRGIVVYTYGDANEDAPTHAVRVSGQDAIAPQDADDLCVTRANDKEV